MHLAPCPLIQSLRGSGFSTHYKPDPVSGYVHSVRVCMRACLSVCPGFICFLHPVLYSFSWCGYLHTDQMLCFWVASPLCLKARRSEFASALSPLTGWLNLGMAYGFVCLFFRYRVLATVSQPHIFPNAPLYQAFCSDCLPNVTKVILHVLAFSCIQGVYF